MEIGVVTPILSYTEKVARGGSTELTPNLATRRVNGAWLQPSRGATLSIPQTNHNP
jgi:hypothetical protein